MIRQIERARERRDEALERYAREKYGHEVQLADLHPDMKALCSLVFAVVEAHRFGDNVAVDNGLGAIGQFVDKYATQKGDVSYDSDEREAGADDDVSGQHVAGLEAR